VARPIFGGIKRQQRRVAGRVAIKAISTWMQAPSIPLSQAVVRLDGQYSNGAIVADPVGLAAFMRER